MLYRNNSQREPGTPYTGNAAKTQFERTMQREGRIITTYTGGTEFRAFFRIRDEHENQRETIIMYYDITAPVRPGALVIVGYGIFLALNRETTENNVYYKSTLVRCNGMYNENNGKIQNIPFYSNNMKASVSVGNNIITMLNGNIELLMEENSLSKQIEINASFNEFDRTFKVTNKYTIDGVTHILAEVQADQNPTITYSIKLDGVPSTSVEPDTTIQLSATPYLNESITTGATFEWVSADHSIAIIDNTGKITALSEGTVKISVTWIEKDVSEFVYITVARENITPIYEYKYSITGNVNLKCGYKRAYTLSVTDENGSIINNVDFQWNVISDFEVIQNSYGNKIELRVNDKEKIDSTFVLQVIVNGEIKTEMTITVVE